MNPQIEHEQTRINALDIVWSQVPTEEPVGGGLWLDEGALKISSGIPPEFTTQPGNQSVTEPDPATFTVVATNANSYQWQKSDDGGTNWADVDGATSASYTTAATSNADNNDQYRCVATGEGGTTTSNVATLTVDNLFDPATLFAGSEEGLIFDFTSESNLSTDIGGTTAVSLLGDAVNHVSDSSGNANEATANRGEPYWSGWPSEVGANIVSSPEFESAGDWTLGTGWTISNGEASKAAGTASSISQAISLTAGTAYVVQLAVTERTAGTVEVSFTGGTAREIEESHNDEGEYFEVMIAKAGNNAVEVVADASFAGKIKIVAVYPVTKMTQRGAYFGKDGHRLVTGNMDMSASDEMTLIVGFKAGYRPGNAYIGQAASTATGSPSLSPGFFSFFESRSREGAAWDQVNASIKRDRSTTYVGIVDLSAGTIEEQHIFKPDNRDLGLLHTQSALTASSISATNKLSLGTWLNNNSFYSGLIHRAILIDRKLTDTEIDNAVSWASFDPPNVAVIGDSTWEQASDSQSVHIIYSTQTSAMIGGCNLIADISTWGDDLDEQEVDWDALPASVKAELDCVVIAVGHNDIKGRIESGATVIQRLAALQSFIDKVSSETPSGCVIIGMTLLPCKDWLDGGSNPTATYAAWQAWNEAVQGNGANAITGLDHVVTAHTAALNDGADAMASIYNPQGDGIHPGSYGRWVVAQEVRKAMVTAGLLKTPITV